MRLATSPCTVEVKQRRLLEGVTAKLDWRLCILWLSLVTSMATDDALYMSQNLDGSLAESRVPLGCNLATCTTGAGQMCSTSSIRQKRRK